MSGQSSPCWHQEKPQWGMCPVSLEDLLWDPSRSKREAGWLFLWPWECAVSREHSQDPPPCLGPVEAVVQGPWSSQEPVLTASL